MPKATQIGINLDTHDAYGKPLPNGGRKPEKPLDLSKISRDVVNSIIATPERRREMQQKLNEQREHNRYSF